MSAAQDDSVFLDMESQQLKMTDGTTIFLGDICHMEL